MPGGAFEREDREAAAGRATMRVLVLSDDRWHPGTVVREGLAPLSDQGFSFDWIEDPAALRDDTLGEYPVVVLAKSNNISAEDETPWMTDEMEKRFTSYVEQGNGLLIVHSGSAGYQECAAFRRLSGGVFDNHPPECEVTVTPSADHPAKF